MPVEFTEQDFEDAPVFTEEEFFDSSPVAVAPPPAAAPAPSKTGILDIGLPEWIAQKLGMGPAPKTQTFITPSPLPTGGIVGTGAPPVDPSRSMVPFVSEMGGIESNDIPLIPAGAKPWVAEAANQALGLGSFMTSPLGAAGTVGGLPGLGVVAGMTAQMASDIPELAQKAGEVSADPNATQEQKAKAYLGLGVPIAMPAIPLALGAVGRGLKPREARAAEPSALQVPELPSDIKPRLFEVEGIGEVKPLSVAPDGQMANVVSTETGKTHQVPVSSMKEKGVSKPAAQTTMFSELDSVLKETPEQKVQVVSEIPEGQLNPFAKGGMATVGPNGETLINGPVFKRWMDENLKDHSPSERKQAIQSLLAEEANHGTTINAVGNEGARTYWDNLTPVERSAFTRIYFGKGTWKTLPEGYTPEMMGHEAMNHALMRIRRMTPRELVEAKGKEWLTVKSLSMLEGAIFKAREMMGTEASQLQRDMLDKTLNNIQTLKATLGGQQPQAFRKEDVDRLVETPIEEVKAFKGTFGGGPTGFAWELGSKARTPEDVAMLKGIAEESSRKSGSLMKEGKFDEAMEIAGRQPSEAYEFATGVKLNGTPKWETFEKMVPGYRPSVPDAKYLQAKGETAPAAYRKPTKGKEETPFLLPPMPGEGKGPAPSERPSAVEMGAAQPESASLKSAASDAAEHLAKAPLPSFKKFMKAGIEKYGPDSKPILEQAWQDSIWPALQGMKGEELAQLRDRLQAGATKGTVRQRAEERKAKGIKIADTQELAPKQEAPFSLESEPIGAIKKQVREEKKAVAKETAQDIKAKQDVEAARIGHRARLIREIGDKLFEESQQPEPNLSRTTLTADDIGWGKKPDEFIDIDPSEPVGTLGNRLTENARLSGESESVTRRVAVIKDNLTGEVFTVSAYKPGKGEPMIVDPAKSGERPNVTVKSLFGKKTSAGGPRYTPIASVLLDEPVRNFRQRFESREAWEERFAQGARQEAQTRGRASETMREVSEGQVEPEAAPEPFTEKFNRPVTDAEAGAVYNHFAAEEVRSVEDVNQAFSDLFLENQSIREMSPVTRSNKAVKDRERKLDVVLGALAKMGRTVERAEGLDGETALGRVLDWIYEKVGPEGTAQRRSEFIGAAIKDFTKPVGEPAPSPETIAGREAAGLVKPSAAQELTMRERIPPTAIPGETLPKTQGPPGVMETGAPEQVTPKEMLPSFIEARERKQAIQRERRLKAAGERRNYTEWLHEHEGLQPSPRPGEPSSLQTPQAYLKPAAVSTLKAVRDTVSGVGRWYSEWMVDRLRRVGGRKTNDLMDVFNQMISREHELYGSLTPVLDQARREAGKLGRATTWLHRINPITNRAGTSNTVGAIEGTIPVPDYAKKVVGLGQASNLEIGKVYEPVSNGFAAGGGFQRNLTALGYDFIRTGRGRAWEDWTEGLAKANKYDVDDVRGFFKEWKSILDDPMPDTARLEKVNQDFARTFPEVITHVKTGDIGGGQWEPVMHADLFNYLENAARRATHVRAFREKFPIDTEGRSLFEKTQKESRSELPAFAQEDFDALVKALHGHPTDSYAAFGFLRPGEPVGDVFRFLNQTIGQPMSRMVLSGQMFVQPGENLAGATPVFLGYKNYVRALAQLKQLYPQLEQQGAVNRVIYDMTFDSTGPMQSIRSLSRITGNVISKAFGEQVLNELQEGAAAATARVVSERLQAGTISSWEQRQLPQTFKVMGFTPPEIKRLMIGEPEILSQFERKAASFLTSGNKAIAEGSRIGANRLFNSVFRFQSYPMMKLNQLRRVSGNWLETMKSGSVPDKVAASEQMARFMFGTTLQGALTVGITALAYEGLFGAKIKQQEAKDEPVKFLAESFLATIGGPLYLVWRGAQSKGLQGIGEQAGRMFFPYQIVRELTDAAHGGGTYRDMSAWDRMGKFVQQKLPGTRALSLGISAVGLSQNDAKLDASIKAFYRWRRDELGFTEREGFLKDDERADFRTAMKQAVEALKKGDFDAYYDAIGIALGEAGADRSKIKDSLSARKLLKTPNGKALDADQLESLGNRIGGEALDRLMYFDTMLDKAADGVFLPKYE